MLVYTHLYLVYVQICVPHPYYFEIKLVRKYDVV